MMPSDKQAGALYDALFSTDSRPDEEVDQLKRVLTDRADPPKRSVKSLGQLLQDRLTGNRNTSECSIKDIVKSLGAESISSDPRFDVDDCSVDSIPDFEGLGGRRHPDFHLSHVVTEGATETTASGASLYANAHAGCGTERSKASAYLGFWIYPTTKVPFHQAKVTAHLVGNNRQFTSNDAGTDCRLSLEVGRFFVPTGRTRPGYAPIVETEYVLTTSLGSSYGPVPSSFSIEFQTQINVFHYVFLGVHALATAAWSDCGEYREVIERFGHGNIPDHREELPKLSTADATVNLAICAFDVSYEPLVLPEYIERKRLRDQTQRIRPLRDR